MKIKIRVWNYRDIRMYVFPPVKHFNEMTDMYKTRYEQYAIGRDSKDIIPKSLLFSD
jgi:hypothetical protein